MSPFPKAPNGGIFITMVTGSINVSAHMSALCAKWLPSLQCLMMATGLPTHRADDSLCRADHLVKPRMNAYYEEPENTVMFKAITLFQLRTGPLYCHDTWHIWRIASSISLLHIDHTVYGHTRPFCMLRFQLSQLMPWHMLKMLKYHGYILGAKACYSDFCEHAHIKCLVTHFLYILFYII